MQGLFPGGFLASDDGCVIVALSAGYSFYIELSRRAGFTLRASRALGTGGTSGSGLRFAATGCDKSDGYNHDSQEYKNFLQWHCRFSFVLVLYRGALVL
jgi:hypothetical protein